MRDILLLRLDAPLMSFGGATVDNIGISRELPALSMLAGLLANALGLDHSQHQQLQRLQTRIRFAARLDRRGRDLLDYQTVDLGQPPMLGPAWTSRGYVEERGKGEATEGTHVRLRHYRVDALCTIALTLEPEAEWPTLEELEAALVSPERPLYLGRKSCPPAAPLMIERARFNSLLDALEQTPLDPRADRASAGLLGQWLEGERATSSSRLVAVCDERDWENQAHSGERLVRQGLLSPKEKSND